MGSTSRIVALSHLLLSVRERGLAELEKAPLPDEVKSAIRNAFVGARANSEAIRRLLDDESMEVRAAGGVIDWVEKSQADRWERLGHAGGSRLAT
jgi:hypothetical protein